ncbi:MAG UNVERIFIED_CONTAM: hypothetical protein LVQ98_08425 [Rickettsiaceae bacterium]|jgi:hypothetical protein
MSKEEENANVFAGNLTEAEAKVSIRDTIRNLNDAITKYSQHSVSIEANNKKLEDSISILAGMQKKLEDITSEISINIIEHFLSITGEIKNALAISQAKQFEEIKSSFIECVDDIRLEAKELSSSLNLILKKHQQEMLESTYVINKNKIKNLLGILLVSICFSVFSSWLVNRHFPRLIEINKAGNVLIKDSNVLLPNNDRNKMQK